MGRRRQARNAVAYRNGPAFVEKVQSCRKTSIDTFYQTNISPGTYFSNGFIFIVCFPLENAFRHFSLTTFSFLCQ